MKNHEELLKENRKNRRQEPKAEYENATARN
jgi:hypothetical protein